MFFSLVDTLIQRLILKLEYWPKSIKIGPNSTIKKRGFINFQGDFYAGPGFFCSTNKYNPIYIGEKVMCGPNVMIIGGNHDFRATDSYMFHSKNESQTSEVTIIEKDCWIGAGAIILSGSKICEGSVIGAGSIVNSFLPPFTISFGIPAKPHKPRFDDIQKLSLYLSTIGSKYNLDEIYAMYEKYQLRS